MNLKVSVAINRLFNSMGNDSMILEFTDNMSGDRFLSVEMDMESFAYAITGHHMSKPCHEPYSEDSRKQGFDATLNVRHVGRERQIMSKQIPFKHTFTSGREEEKRNRLAREALAPYEIDGWKGTRQRLIQLDLDWLLED